MESSLTTNPSLDMAPLKMIQGDQTSQSKPHNLPGLHLVNHYRFSGNGSIAPSPQRSVNLPTPVLPSYEGRVFLNHAVDEAQLARLGTTSDQSRHSPLANVSPSLQTRRKTVPCLSSGLSVQDEASPERRSSAPNTSTVTRPPRCRTPQQIDHQIQKNRRLVATQHPHGEAFEVLVVPVRMDMSTYPQDGKALINVNILFPTHMGQKREGVRLVNKTCIPTFPPVDSDAPWSHSSSSFTTPTVGPGRVLPIPDNPMNTVFTPISPVVRSSAMNSPPPVSPSIRRGSLLENCNYPISRYTARNLPVLFAVLIQTKIPIDKPGFDIVLPMLYPIAWPDTVRYLQTGYEELLSEQVKGNIACLGGRAV